MKEIIHIETITEVHNLLGLPKPKHPLVSVLDLDGHIIDYDFGDATYVLGLYQVSLKSNICATISYGRNSYDFQEGTLIFTKPGQSLSYEDSTSEPGETGWILLFHPDLIRKSELGQNIEDYSFFSYDVHEALHLSDDEKQWITDIVRKIEKEYSQNLDQHSQKLIISNIELLLDYCTRYYDRQFYTRTNLNKDLVSKFEHLLTSYYQSDKPIHQGIPSVKYCGEALNMSPNYLSDLLKKETGRNAQEHIHAYLIDKAKTKLLGSVEPVSSIAYDLGFEYPQHFSKIFKAKTGMSPSEYRNLN
ncbi:MAG: helix-turn-helix domain-containing protein [Saprospiraceae bacterium]